MKVIRRFLIHLLGFRRYVGLVSSIYLFFVRRGYLRSKYPELFFLEKIIQPGFTCLDIGANVGYYSTFMSSFAGEKGKVYAIEPVAMFAKIWKRNLRKARFDNLELLPYALGRENKIVQMGTPEVDGVAHHGMTKVITSSEEKIMKIHEVEMRIPDELFANLEKLDFVKCDVEGFETEVIPAFIGILTKFKPMLQIEITGTENKKLIYQYLKQIGYSVNILSNEELIEIDSDKMTLINCDFYFKADSGGAV